jgi:hypothetical protein
MTPDQRTLALRIALTVSAVEFFGPAIRDAGASHALNPDWVGHARLHLVWLLGFMVLSGFVNVYFIWFRRPVLESLRLSAVWQTCNIGGFWLAVLFQPAYGGSVTMPGIHMAIFGIDENVFGFSVLTAILAAAWLGLRGGTKGEAEVGDGRA